MGKLNDLYRKTGWHTVFSYDDEATSARTNLLYATITQNVVSGFSSGIFYTGLLLGYGIDLVNISIVTFIPYITSFFTLLTPFILERFPRRRLLLSVARIAYYVINILGVTFLPQLISDPDGRVVGLVVTVFLANAINNLFSGYTPWHMPYITPEVRTAYFSATSLVGNISCFAILIVASLVTDRLTPDGQFTLIIFMRILAFLIALLEVYFLQKPKEPQYLVSTRKHSLLNIFKLPLSNKRFRMTLLIYALYQYIANIASSLSNTWLLQEVQVGYLYVNVINFMFSLFVIGTSAMWGKVMRKIGTFSSLGISCMVLSATFFAYAFVNHGNFIWLMTAVRIAQHGIGMLQSFSVNNLLYINMPKTDQTNYTSLYTFTGNLAIFLGMMTGTGIVAAIGDDHWLLFNHSLSGVPVTMLLQGVLILLLSFFVFAIRKKVEPEGVKI